MTHFFLFPFNGNGGSSSSSEVSSSSCLLSSLHGATPRRSTPTPNEGDIGRAFSHPGRQEREEGNKEGPPTNALVARCIPDFVCVAVRGKGRED